MKIKSFYHHNRWISFVILMSCFLWISDIMAITETVTYSMNVDEVEFAVVTAPDGQSYTKVIWSNGSNISSEAGIPDIPYVDVCFLVPQNTRNFNITVDYEEESIVQHAISYPVIPVQTSVNLNTPLEDIKFVSISKDLYSGIPNSLGEFTHDGFVFGDKHIVYARLYPISYSYKDNIISVIPEMKVTLEYEECQESELTESIIHPGCDTSEVELALASMDFINKSHLQKIVTKITDEVSSSYYYIIVPESLEAAVEDLALWKRQKGYNVIVRTIEDILRLPEYKIGVRPSLEREPIMDEGSALRAYLQDEFGKNGVFYCLLIGDWRTSMPIRKYRPSRIVSSDISLPENNYNGEFMIPSDNYFSDLTTYFGVSKLGVNNGLYVAYMPRMFCPDIFVGRLLCTHAEELSNYIKKLRLYESYPGRGDYDYLTRAFYFENNPNCNPDNGSNLESLTGKSIESLKELNVFNEIIYAQDKDSINGYEEHSMPMYGADIVSYMRRTGFNSWYGHGCPSGILTCGSRHYLIPINTYTGGSDGQVGRPVDSNDKPNGIDMMDNINYPSVTYTGACATAPFDRMEEKSHIFDIPYNIAGAYTVAGLYGGVGIIAHSRSVSIDGSRDLQLQFSKQVKRTPKFGIANTLSKVGTIGIDNNAISSCNLIGDSEFEMWLKIPKNLNVTADITNGCLVLSSSESYDARLVVFDGRNQILSDSFNGDTVLSAIYWDFMPMVSIWSTGYIPFMRLYGPQGTFRNVVKRYLPYDAYLGHMSENAFSSYCEIGDGATIEINAIKHVEISEGIVVTAGGRIEISCDETIVASGNVVQTGGSLTLKAKETELTNGFGIETGGVLSISPL